jgi:hypothetical protein
MPREPTTNPTLVGSMMKKLRIFINITGPPLPYRVGIEIREKVDNPKFFF